MGMPSNTETLARIRTLAAIGRAKCTHLDSPEQRVMRALESAIKECCERLVELATYGRVDSAEYRKVETQLREWDAAWRSNR